MLHHRVRFALQRRGGNGGNALDQIFMPGVRKAVHVQAAIGRTTGEVQVRKRLRGANWNGHGNSRCSSDA